ncbi:AAA family ATPase [Roseibium sediminis]|uniref:AAA family ATPase n=1 Tax=Roseibium sediminis TaxID=1775174 RepID=UPI00123CADE4|nr:AAA family ATPase [Roseibium sediminis]
MNTQSATSISAKQSWDGERQTPALTDNRTEADIRDWTDLTERVRSLGIERGWSQGEVSRRCGVASSTFNPWFLGKYPGRLGTVNQKMRNWLDQVAETQDMIALIPSSPDYVKTRLFTEIFSTLAWAQATDDVAVITCAAGVGKTATCERYRDARPNVFMATMSPNTKTPYAMLIEIAEELDVQEHNPAKLGRAIGRKLERAGGGTLLIIDEAQNLHDDAINQLRHFSDKNKCGLALVGNNEIYDRFTKGNKANRSYDQLKSRFGKRIERDKPYEEDILAFISAWGVREEKAVRELKGIALKGGALRQIDKTMKLATMIALGDGREEVTVTDIMAAWKNRNVNEAAL